VSLYNPSAGKNSGKNGGTQGKNSSEEPETNSPNSQTHTEDDDYDRMWQERVQAHKERQR
jgi:hypothetical protein